MDSASGSYPTSPGSDLSSKYTKLASEYSKIRAQLGVLKKAVLDEQVKTGDLSEMMRQKDQTMRKTEAEMESLQFRNQQLAKRVEVLQEELEHVQHREQASGKKASHHHHDHLRDQNKVAASENLNSVFGEELQLKIEENARLQSTLSDIDKKYEEKMDVLHSRIRELESKLSKINQAERAEDAKQKELIHGLKVENVDLNLKISELQKELDDRNDRITLLQVQLESSCSPSSIGGKQFPPPMTSSSSYLLLNATEARIQTVEVLSLVGEGLQEFVAAMSDFHTYWEHRLKDTKLPDGRWSCENAGKLSKLLLQNVKHLKPIEESYHQVLSEILSSPGDSGTNQTRRKFSNFSQHFKNYVDYAKCEIEPLVISCLQHESNSFTCSPTQQAKNGQFQTSLRGFDSLLHRLAEFLTQLVDQQEPPKDLVSNITVTVSKLHQQSAEMSTIYSTKAVDENSLPTVSRQLINTNDCIVASLSSLVAALNRLSRNLSDNLQRLTNLVCAKFEESSSVDRINIEKSMSVDSTDSSSVNVDHGGGLVDAELVAQLEEARTEVGNLRHELDSLAEKLKKAEQSKEHWKLECQLLQMRHDKLKEKSPAAVAESGDHNPEPIMNGNQSDDIKEAYKTRLDTLVSEKLLADSKAAHFYLECVALQKRLKDREKAKSKAEVELRNLEEQMRVLRDEMGLTATSYEGQLSLMSEHVASMNDKLATQTDQIERLKYELNQRSNNVKKK